MAPRAGRPRPLPIGVIGRISPPGPPDRTPARPVYAASGLEPGWYDILAALRRAGPPYRLRPIDFAATLMLTTSGTTKRLDGLEAAGHITRAPDPGDRRGVLITLTPRAAASSTPPPVTWPTSGASSAA